MPRAAEIGARDGTMASAPLPKSYAIVAHRAAPQMPVSARGALARPRLSPPGRRPRRRSSARCLTPLQNGQAVCLNKTAVRSVDEAGIDAAVVLD